MSSERIEFYVANLDCENEAGTIRRGLQDFPGVLSAEVFASSGKINVTFDSAQVSVEEIKQKLFVLGFPPQQGLAIVEMPKPWKNPNVLASGASGLLLLLGWGFELADLAGPIPLVLYLSAMVVGGYFFGREAIEELFFEREIGIELLMTIAAIAAAALGQLAEAAMLAFLYSMSEAAEGYTTEKSRAAIKALMKLAPKMALIKNDNAETEIPVEELKVGDIFIVRPGQSIATDGIILVGASSLNQSSITGESIPIEKGPGDSVFAGTLNGEGALEVRATKSFTENTLSKIIHLVEEAQEKKGKSHRFIEQFGKRYSPVVLLLGALIATAPPLILAEDWASWLIRATIFIVAAAPCALVISVPITLVATLGTGARNGVLIKGGLYVEELAKIKVVALDKTGTLTYGEPEVTEVLSLGPNRPSPDQVLAIAAGIERLSEHPLAKAIVRYADAQGVTASKVSDFRALMGSGAQALLDGTPVFIGSPKYFSETHQVDLSHIGADICRLQHMGQTVVLLMVGSEVLGIIGIRDAVRPNARRTVEELHRLGIKKVAMLTGDNEAAAIAIAQEVGIDEVHADLRPEDKVRVVHELSPRYGHVAMVGDGVNDAPALAAATVGVAMGAAGSDVALETADVALMADDLEKLVYALQLAGRNQRTVNQNLVLSVVVIGVLVVGALWGVFTLPMAVLGHEISEFIVIASGLRMLRS